MFAKVAEERSFAAAARAMGVSVATVSRAVTRLEERLGGRLFNRTSRRLALTDYGRTLAERASKIYADAEETEDFAHQGLQSSAGPRQTLSRCPLVRAGSHHCCRNSFAAIPT